jgi:hypothetical protein
MARGEIEQPRAKKNEKEEEEVEVAEPFSNVP